MLSALVLVCLSQLVKKKKKLAAVLATSVRFEELRRIHCYSNRFEGRTVIPTAWHRLSIMETPREGLADPMRFSVFQAHAVLM